MIFQNLENLYLIAVLFISHRLIKSYPTILFPLTKIPFVRLVESKKEQTKQDLKKQKKLEKNLKQGQRVISYEKGILIGALENMMDINYLVDFMQFQYIILTTVGMMVIKITSFLVYHVLGLKTKFTENFLVKNNLLNILLVASVLYFYYKLVNYKLAYKGIKGSESVSSFIITFIFAIFVALIIYGLSKHLIVDVKMALGLFNQYLQFLIGVISTNPKNQIFVKVTEENFKLVLLFFTLFTYWILASPILKFGKIYNIVNSAIRNDEERLETLEGERNLNKENIEKINEIMSGNKKRLRYLLLSLTFDILILILFIKPIVKDFFNETYIKKYHFLLIIMIAILSLCFKIYTSRIELQIKYTSLFQKLINYKPKDEVYHEIYKTQIDFIYKESLKDAFIILSKVIIPIFILFIALSLEFRELTFRGNESQITKDFLRIEATGSLAMFW